jgi:hypothetical protein
MILVMKKELLTAAINDDETRIKLSLAVNLEDVRKVLTEFALKKGISVEEVAA